MKMARKLLGAGVLLVCCIAASARLMQSVGRVAAARSMAGMLPQGALLTIESPDFSALLRQWNDSPQQRAWLASENYSVFSRSHLFGRLDDARQEFEAAAKASPRAAISIDGDFLTQVAGHQSIFAWYDVGKLEFLYITRIDAAQAANLSLIKDHAAWSARQVNGNNFYIRRSSAAAPAAADAEQQGDSAQGKARTVAFAQVSDAGGDLLILATREDLIANALQLLHPAANAPVDSVAQELWFTEASAAQPQESEAPVLHMVMNLDRLVPLPYFSSYWVQQNVTRMKQYRAAVSDLYREQDSFRERRALLLNASAAESEETDLDSLAATVPSTGAFRAAATKNPEDAITAIEDKLLGRNALADTKDEAAPEPSVDVPQEGANNSGADYETRIDALSPVTSASSNKALAELLKTAGLDAVVTYSTAQPPATATGLWVPIRSAVVLHGTKAWKAQGLQVALQQSLRGSLTTASLGIQFRAETGKGATVYALDGAKPLFFAARGNLCLLADDRALLRTMLEQASRPAAADHSMATVIAGFDHTAQRAPYGRLTRLIDGTNHAADAEQSHVQPAYFSGNVRSLSDAFAAIVSERFEERRDGAVMRQTVRYRWQTP